MSQEEKVNSLDSVFFALILLVLSKGSSSDKDITSDNRSAQRIKEKSQNLRVVQLM